jgi:hypothetical protein
VRGEGRGHGDEGSFPSGEDVGRLAISQINPVAFAASAALEFRTAQPVTVETQVKGQAPGD